MQSTLYSCPILIKLEISRQLFEKYQISFLHTYLRHYEEGFINQRRSFSLHPVRKVHVMEWGNY
jgi:hypothetical protein